LLLSLLAIIALVTGATAQGSDRTYQAAETSFMKQDMQMRQNRQMLLAASGYLASPITKNFNRDLHRATLAFQKSGGWPQNGKVLFGQREALIEEAFPVLLNLGFRATPHPTERHSVWVPLGRRLRAIPDPLGIKWENLSEGIAMSFVYIPGASIADGYAAAQKRARDAKGSLVKAVKTGSHYETLFSTRDGQQEFDSFHTHKKGILGIFVKWRPNIANQYMDRAVVIMAGSLSASLNKLPFPDPVSAPAGTGDVYREAQQAYEKMDREDRQTLQTWLIAAGELSGPTRDTYTFEIHNALSNVQREHGLAPTAIPNEDSLKALGGDAVPQLANWGFTEFTHPTEAYKIWMPAGLDLHAKKENGGIRLTSTSADATIAFLFLDGDEPALNLVEEIKARRAVKHEIMRARIKADHYELLTRGEDGQFLFSQFHKHKSGSLGLMVGWNPKPGIAMERVVDIMSSSLRVAMTGEPFPAPLDLSAAASETAPEEGAREDETKRLSSGTGFFVSPQGHILTNAHVAGDCGDILVTLDNQASEPAALVAVDTINDLALLKVASLPRNQVAFRSGARVGEAVAAFGFPLTGTLASSGNFTTGNITALSGMADDSRFLQISVPVQPGNSGGPLVDTSGHLIGVITAKLNALAAAEQTGDIPQNVNFALKADLAMNFLESHDVSVNEAGIEEALAPAELADKTRGMTTFIVCSPQTGKP
jgi:S1-C subfamily serine protease